jgi:hypothetical protein
METRKYLKDGKECFLCLSRKKLIQITPEEKVRQEFISKLAKEYKVPFDLIDVEVPLSYFSKNLRGRADIIAYEYSEKENSNFPLILVECKEPNVPLTDKVFEQVYNYDSHLLAKLIIVTNGIETIAEMFDEEKNEYYEIENIPTYTELLTDKTYNRKKNEFVWERPKFNEKAEWKKLVDEGFIGEDSSSEFYSFFTNLYGFLFDEKTKINTLSITNFKLINDEGIRFTTFGNSAGGSFAGDYRYWILEDSKKENQIISISIMGKLSSTNHPKFGNSKGLTLLLVAIDNFENSHLSLELSIDRFTNFNNNYAEIIHDGTLTVGNKGRVKNLDVINFISEKRPTLIKDNKIYLGKLTLTEEININQQETKSFLENIIDYAILRDEFRKTK